MRYRALVLDVGNVLVSVCMDEIYRKGVELELFEDENAAFLFMKNIEQIQNLGITDVYNAIAYHDSITRRLSLLTHTPYHHQKVAKMKQIYTEFAEYWQKSQKVWTPNLQVLDYVSDALSRRVVDKVYICSNMGIDHARFIRASHPLFDKSLNFFSYQMGVVKPYFTFWKTWYDRFMSNEVNSYSMLYVDDRSDYIDGWKMFWGYDNQYVYGRRPSVDSFQFDSTQTEQSVLIDRLKEFGDEK